MSAKVSKHLAAGLGPVGDEEELHKARKAGKRARYAAELAHPVLGKTTRNSVKRYQICRTSSASTRTGWPPPNCRIAAGTAEYPEENRVYLRSALRPGAAPRRGKPPAGRRLGDVEIGKPEPMDPSDRS